MSIMGLVFVMTDRLTDRQCLQFARRQRQVNRGCIDIQQIFCEDLTEAGHEHHTVCHRRHFVDPRNRLQPSKKKKKNPERS